MTRRSRSQTTVAHEMAARSQTSTYEHDWLDVMDLASGLAGFGYEVGAAMHRRCTLLDTFDGRLHGAGLTLVASAPTGGGGAVCLELSTCNGIPATIEVRRPPRFASDLPPGPFRERISGPMAMRALLPRFSWATTTIEVVARDRRDNVVVRATAQTIGDTPDARSIVEVTGMPGHDRAAEQLIGAIRALGGHPADGRLIDLLGAAHADDRRGFDSSPDVDLDHDIAAIDGFRAVLGNLANTIDANLGGTLDDLDSEFLHEFRVAIRRTRSVLGFAKNVMTDHTRESFRREFAWLAGVTGPVRDLDVYVLEWDRAVGHLAHDRTAELRPVLLHLQRHRRSAFHGLVGDLRSDRARRLLAEWPAALTDLEPSPDADRPLRQIVAGRIVTAHRTVIANGRRIDAASPAEALHDLRKDAKKLRYAVECFGGLLPNGGRKAFVRQLKDLQDNLGRHQDAEVHSDELQVVAGELSAEHATPPTLLALGQLIEHLELEKVAARTEFAGRFVRFDSKRTERLVGDLVAALES